MPPTPAEHVAFLEFVRDEIHYAAEAKRQQLPLGYSNETIENMVRGIEWAEASQRILALSGFRIDVLEQVASVLRRELTIGTVEQIDGLFTPAVRSLRDAWEGIRSGCDGDNTSCSSMIDLIGRVVRRLKAKPNLLRSYDWDHSETLNVSGINSAAAAIGLGPIFAVGDAPDWAHAPNLPLDHPVNQRRIPCLTVYHPDGNEHRVRRTGGLLDDQSSLPVDETIARLDAWANKAIDRSRVAAVKVGDELGTPLDQIMWAAAVDPSLTKGFQQKLHDGLVERLQEFLEARLPENPRLAILQSLQDRGCDLLIEWPQRAKYGVQLKNNGDVEKLDFSVKTLAQIQDSKQHGLVRLYLVIAADITGVSNSQKVRGMISRISAMNDPYVVVIPPERAWSLLSPEQTPAS
ncbi:MAG: hypothetical protein AABP62_30895 [Planctomycetota bacterium]